MAGNLTLSLLTAQSGLLSNQAALDTSANNIANAHTEGYSRKITQFEQRTVAGAGAGVQIGQITRRVDEGLLKTLRMEFGSLNDYTIQNDFFKRVQETFGTPADNTSIAHKLGGVISSMEALAISPEKILDQSEFINSITEATIKLQDMSDTIQNLRLQADRDIATQTIEINDIIADIARLNESIVRNAVVNRDITDLSDQRDKAIDDLSKIIDVGYFTRSDGGVVVFTMGGQTLVDNITVNVSHGAAGFVAPASSYASGSIGAINITVGESVTDITKDIRSGSLKGLIQMRDETLPGLQSQVDEMAKQIRDMFNQYHNRGVSYPAPEALSGTRQFLNPATQTITFSSGTTKIMLFDDAGNQTAVGNLTGGAPMLAGAGPHTIATVGTTIQTWLQANGAPAATVTFDADGQMNIDLKSTTLGIGFRDEDVGGNHVDATIQFDKNNGALSVDETISGFSNFFGLNDLFVDDLKNNIKQSALVSSTYSSTPGTLEFYDSTGLLAGSPLAVGAGNTLQDIANLITANVTNVVASVVPEGSGQRLIVQHANGSEIEVTQTAGTILTDIGIRDSNIGLSQSIDVRKDIYATPSLLVRGSAQWNASLGAAGQYFISEGDGNIMASLVEKLHQSMNFDAAGNLGDSTLPLMQYASSVISRNTSQANSMEGLLANKQFLTDSLQYKSDSVRGVNLDEEMSNLILFEQAYSASARVISVIQSMLDALERAIG
ncbi:MAG: flagellar hook-associated protein FlgK [Rhodospirillaceae bacterium]|nr:flagellar hook-associated protein FlgK [Rhodospirillaceae bacterium]